ncbi:MAG: FtsQ-type POTRA domain-containing protein [Pyrinomonadaceae bacterium]|nr:FtsQ-type POTRA domain-containing protein [Pyrinomonadaceae bacterium]
MAKRKTTRRRKTTTATRRKPRRRKKNSDKLVNFFVPLFLLVCIVGALGFVLFFGFKSVAASPFFEVEKVETNGLRVISKETVERIVRNGTAGKGVWGADLHEIQIELSKIDYVRHVSVSRVLPNTIRVMVAERKPVGLVRSGDKIYRIDTDARLLEPIPGITRDRENFLMTGWNPDISDDAEKENKKRLELYLTLKEEWQRFGLSRRVISVDLEKIRDVQALITDSGETVRLSLGSEDFANRLKEGIKHSAGNGKRISRIILDGASPVIVYRD